MHLPWIILCFKPLSSHPPLQLTGVDTSDPKGCDGNYSWRNDCQLSEHLCVTDGQVDWWGGGVYACGRVI